MSHAFDRLYRPLDYHFKNPAYLKQALTHCSMGDQNYERLEFLGDSILNMTISCALFVILFYFTDFLFFIFLVLKKKDSLCAKRGKDYNYNNRL